MNGAAEALLQLCSLVVCRPIQSFFVPAVHRFSLPVLVCHSWQPSSLWWARCCMSADLPCAVLKQIKAVTLMGKCIEIHWWKQQSVSAKSEISRLLLTSFKKDNFERCFCRSRFTVLVCRSCGSFFKGCRPALHRKEQLETSWWAGPRLKTCSGSYTWCLDLVSKPSLFTLLWFGLGCEHLSFRLNLHSKGM